MIIKGTSRTGPVALAQHLGNAEKNERVQLLETFGTIASDLRGALIEMDTYAMGTRCSKPLYHAAISPEPPHRLTDDQRKEAVDALEKKLGLDGHARVVVLHEKEGREHIHVVWTRIDIHHMRSVSDSHNYRKHEEVARDLERRFGHERVQGAHHERIGPDGKKIDRPDRTPSRSELRQEEKTGIKGRDVKAEVTALFEASDNANAFCAALASRDYQIAEGDRRDYVIVDWRGGVHSLARRIEGVKAADLRKFMEGVDREWIASISTAQQIAKARLERKALVGEDRLAARYGRSEDYVTQSQAAQRDFQKRSDALTERAKDQRKEEERRRREDARDAASGEVTGSRKTDDVSPSVEMTDAMQAKLDQLRAQHLSDSSTPDPGRQNQAPGGGRSRGR